MRISTLQQYNLNITRMQDSQTTLGQLQNQISTGKKHFQPSDDPAAVAQSVRLERDIAALDRYENNMTVATNRLELQETVLSDLNTQFDRMYERVIAVSGTLNDSNRETIATEIREIVAGMAGAMNTKDSQGEYLFAGSKGGTQPYVLNSSGRWEYQGDNGARDVQIGATHYVASTDSGQYLFESVSTDLQDSHSGATNVDPATSFSFKADFEEERYEAYLKSDVEGDLQFKTYAVAPAGDYRFDIVDTAGNVHLSQTLPGASPFPQEVGFEGLTISVNVPGNGDYSLSQTSASKNGITDIQVADKAAMEQMFEDYGEVTINFHTPIVGQYQLQSAKTGGLVSINDVDTFAMPASIGAGPDGTISVGGLNIEVDVDDATIGSYTLSPPSLTNSVTQISSFTGVEVSNTANFEAAMLAAQALGDTYIEVNVTPGLNLNIVSQPGNNPISSILAPAAPSHDDALNSGLKFDFNSLTGGETFRIELDDGAGNQFTTATSTVEIDYERKNILNIGLDIAQQLEQGTSTPEDQEALNGLLSDTITYIQTAQDRVSEVTTKAGARLAAMEDTKIANADMKLFTQTTLSNVQDADLAEVASKLKLEEVLLQASQQTFASVSQMTLFNYIS